MADAPIRLHQIVYVSRSLIGERGATVREIARVALPRNAAAGITGALFYDGERFAQVLEGPWAETSLLMEAIRYDSRHFDVRVLRDAPLRARRFADWSLRLVDRAQAPGVEALLARERPGPALALELADRLAQV